MNDLSRWAWLAGILITLTYVFTATSGEEKLIFLKDRQIARAEGDGSELKILSEDKSPKADLSWSPDGTKIQYRTPGQYIHHPKTHAVIAIITDSGKPLTQVNVLATESQRIMVGGMRFVEKTGWHSNSTIFATGSANPRTAEYRIIDLLSGHVITSYFGSKFSTCANKGRVAYLKDQDAQSRGTVQLSINDRMVYSLESGVVESDLYWIASCERVAFVVRAKDQWMLVVIHNDTVEAKIELEGSGAIAFEIVPFEDYFIVNQRSSERVYDSVSRSLSEEQGLLKRFRELRQRHENVVRQLDAHSAAWWPFP